MLKSADKAAFTELFNRYNRLLYGHAYRRLKDKEEAQDIVQEVFSSLWAKKEILAFNTNFGGYLYTAIRHKILNLLAHRQIESDYVDSLQNFLDTGSVLTDHLIREKQLKALIEKEIAALPPRMRLVFEMSRNQHLSHKAIAEELNITESTVTDQIKKALRILRPRLGAVLFILF
ncbi:RNA polymerase subunit sigma-70 [Pedobacter sp. HMWF019]|nr:RNA polymerase sigma-70 factor [Pedobacter sp. HMWF019]PTS96411.1 RNA polymerase subunit sigma-70 [Pedobacter sp. HMWF019]